MRPAPEGAKADTRGFLGRLARDKKGNVLVLTAAAMIPIVGFVGSGLDLSRAYLVRTRLQQACDAGVLAGRRAVGAGGTLTTAAQGEITKFVNFNFPQQSMDTTAFAIQPTLNAATDTINLTLATSMNTAIMQIFGFPEIDIDVTCSARDDYANIDIMLVLDTTGSMACKPERDAADCRSWIHDNKRGGQTMRIGTRTVTYTAEETDAANTNISRMQALRNAVATLQTQIGQIEAQFNTAPSGARKRVRWSIIPFSQMTNPGLSIGPADTTLYTRKPAWFNTTGSYRSIYTCNGGRSLCTTNAASVPHNSTWMSSTWDGCTEERRTVNTITGNSTYSIPSNLPDNAFDLRFDDPPTSTDTRWTVADPGQTGVSQYACPKAMREWDTMTSAELTNYFAFNQGFVANGATYLDIGLLWGARMLSRGGMWAADNPPTFNGFPVRRYVIFMTDGKMEVGNTGYGAYAQEALWKRTAADGSPSTNDGSPNTAEINHTRRWLMTCTAIRNMDAEIYTISFGAGSTLNADMQACSSGAGYAIKAENSNDLNNVFRSIGENIGQLRLAQ